MCSWIYPWDPGNSRRPQHRKALLFPLAGDRSIGGAGSQKDKPRWGFLCTPMLSAQPSSEGSSPHPPLSLCPLVYFSEFPSKDPGPLRENAVWAKEKKCPGSTQESSYTLGTDQTRDSWAYGAVQMLGPLVRGLQRGKCILSETISVA